VDARPLAGSDHGVAGGRLALQRLACFPLHERESHPFRHRDADGDARHAGLEILHS
jgi:hypothetical protein